MQKSKVVIIATAGLTTNLLYEGVSRKNNVTTIFIEPNESKRDVVKRRFKKLGFAKTAGQILFMLLVLPLIGKRKKRIATILKEANLSNQPIPQQIIQPIKSVHDKALVAQIKKENPSLIIINGTRILKKDFLNQMDCPIINIHVGITPKYRGVHGGYWAIHNHDVALFGVTLHYIDGGIDTGRLIAQEIIPVSEQDNFKTYPILQYCAGIKLLEQNIDAILNNSVVSPTPLTEVSKLHYHPTFKAYLFKS